MLKSRMQLVRLLRKLSNVIEVLCLRWSEVEACLVYIHTYPCLVFDIWYLA
jgi:hypothetical protein